MYQSMMVRRVRRRNDQQKMILLMLASLNSVMFPLLLKSFGGGVVLAKFVGVCVRVRWFCGVDARL
jgi:uncharacterized protein (DUF2062 family)